MEMNAAQVEALVSEIMNKMQANNGAAPTAAAATGSGGYSALGTGGNEPFDLDYGMMDTSGKTYATPYPRIARMLKRVHETDMYVDAERAVLATQAYQMYEKDPVIIKQAKIMAHILGNCTIRIHPDELLVGEMAAPSRSTPIFPEFSYTWVMDELRAGAWTKRNNDVFHITDEDKKALFDIEEYWKGRTVSEAVISMLSDEQAKGSCLGPKPVFFPNLHLWGGVGHIIPRFRKLMKTGWIGLKNEILDCLSKLDENTTEGLERREFYIAQLIVLQALKDYYLRWGKLARDEAATCSDATRKAELLVIADNMEWLSENPPKTFYQAIQYYYLVINCLHIESNGQGNSYGRPDTFLYEFYEKDMKEGRITKWFVGELFETLYIKIHENMRLRDDETCALNSEIGMGGPLLLLGGCDREGKDVTNDLSYIALEAHAHTQLPDPWISCRWSSQAPWEFKVKTINTIKVGTSQPKLFNDEVIIPAMMRSGRSLEDVRDYSVVGCVEVDSGGLEYGEHDAAYFNMGKVMELTCNHGICIDCTSSCSRYQKCVTQREGLGPDYGGLDTYKSFDEVKEAFRKQMDYWVTLMCSNIIACDIAHARMKPLPYASLLIEDCIQNGKDLTAGGARYNFSGPQGIAIGTCGDSFSTIKQLIFEEKKITGKQLLDALKANWKGHEQLLALVNSEHVHHFGNDDDYADELTRFAGDCYCDAVDKHTNYRGGIFHPGMYSVSANVGIGMTTAATPDGRTNYEALSNCLGPVQTKAGGCHDVKGPTAVIRSAAKIDNARCGNGTLLNIRFTPSCVSGETGRDNFIQYVEEYFQRKGWHVQFNIVNTETLKDAQLHPEKYPTLLVRVAGYSAYFTKLSKELQGDLIGRNSYESFD